MADWATRRKLTYLLSFFILLFSLIAILYFTLFYKSATCFDGRKNGSEGGIDCGGSCTRICERVSLDPSIEWSRSFEVGSSTYSLVSYIENPNIDAGTSYAPYTFKVFDGQNKLIFTKSGATIIPAGKRFAVFEGPVTIASIPSRVEFSFGDITWDKVTTKDTFLKTTAIRLTRDNPTPRVDATVENNSLGDVNNIEAVAIVYDDSGNAIGASRTLVDYIQKEKSQGIVFTWPKAFKEQYAQCEVPSDVALVIDRSGSMASDGANPPEPLTSVKNAAKGFIGAMGKGVNVSVISFASLASSPIEEPLISDSGILKNAIDRIAIGTNGPQETNIADALLAAKNSLLATSSNLSVKKSIILLTDGEPTLPKVKGNADAPALAASKQAVDIRDSGIDIYTIGLGNKVNGQLLTDIAASSDRYFKAPTKADLSLIYSNIASALCVKHPVIEIITRIFPGSN